MSLLRPEVRVGVQEPRIVWLPPEYDPTASAERADEMIDLAAVAGLHLDPWQVIAAEGATRVRPDGKFAATRVAIQVNRQCGKGSVMEARQLAGLFLWGERLQVHTAHEFRTAQKHFERILSLIEGTPALDRMVYRVRRADGEEAIETRDGTKLQFMARSLKSGRGITGDAVYLDEAFALKQAMMASLLPTMAARSLHGNVQMWFASSAGMPESEVLHDVREQGLAQSDQRLAYMEWSSPEDSDSDDIDAWYQGNPGLGIRISEDFVRTERGSMGEEEFRRERLGIWAPIGGESFIPPKKWASCLDQTLAEMVTNGEVIDQKLTRVSLGVDVPPDRSYGSVCVAGFREDGTLFTELLAREMGTDWLPAYLADLLAEGKVPILADAFSAVSSLGLEFRQARVPIKFLRSDVYKKACGVFYDKVVQGQLAHKGDADLDAAVSGAQPSSKDKLWAWTSKSVDVSPLVSATLAVHGSLNRPSGDKSAKRRGAVFA